MTLLAFNPPNITINALAHYSIDNGTLFPFPVAAKNPDQIYDLVSFQTGLLSPGPHHLFVEYGIDNFVEGSAPLILDYFIIQNQTLPSVTSSPPNTINPQSHTITPNTTSLQNPTITPDTTKPQSPTISPIVYRAGLSQGAVAGAVIGSLVGLSLIIFCLIRFKKGKRAAASLGWKDKPDAAYGDGPLR